VYFNGRFGLAKNIIIYISDLQSDQVEWLLYDEKGKATSRPKRDSLSDVAALVDGRQVKVVIASVLVTLTTATVAGASARAIKAIPYALEESLSEEVDNLHFAVGTKQQGDVYPVAVVSRDVMDLLQARFNAVGLRPSEMRPECLALPRFEEADNSWTGLLTDTLLILRLDDNKGYSIEADNASFLIGLSLNEVAEKEPAGIVLFKHAEKDIDLNESNIDIESRPCRDVLSLFATGIESSKAINLLQGDYSFKQQFDKAWRPWRSTAILCVCAALVFGGVKLIELSKYSQQVTAQRAQMRDILKRTFPSIKRIVNPRKQMQTRLKQLGATGVDNGFVSVISSINIALQAAGNTKLNSISYKSGRMDIDLETNRLSTLDTLKKTLEKEGQYSMKIESANQTDNRIRGRIRVEVKG
jgi:general secretion pathway protein L